MRNKDKGTVISDIMKYYKVLKLCDISTRIEKLPTKHKDSEVYLHIYGHLIYDKVTFQSSR